MFKKRNKILTIGTILNLILAITGFAGMIFTFMQFIGVDFSTLGTQYVTEEMLSFTYLRIWFDMILVIITIFLCLSGVFSTMGFIRKNNDFIIISIILLVISLIINICSNFYLPDYASILIIINVILLITGYIKESKKKQPN